MKACKLLYGDAEEQLMVQENTFSWEVPVFRCNFRTEKITRNI
jgi:hypothetical protein